MKELLKNNFLLSLEKNYPQLQVYYENKLDHFVELESLRSEIIKCLILELFQSSIFATNHFHERVIKLSLIKKYTIGLNYSQIELYNQKTQEAIEKYDKEVLYKTLSYAKDEGLVTEEEYTELDNFRTTIRNPYSHAEIKKIINKAPAKVVGFMFNFDEVKESLKKGEQIKDGIKTEITTLSSTFSQLYQESFSRELAFNYFETVYRILININGRLDNMRTSNINAL